MYKLAPELKKVLKISLIIAVGLEIIFLIINLKFGITFAIGYLASIIAMIKTNYFVTNALYHFSNPKKTLGMNYFLSMVIYFIALLISFFFGILPGLFCGLGLIVIKIIIVLNGFFQKAGD